jgi:hypothetical protein
LAKDNGKKFHSQSTYHEVNQINGKESKKNFDGHTASQQFINLINKDTHQGDIDDIHDGYF